jgi:glucan biosynthesis protein C
MAQKTQAPTRTYALDNLRTCLTVLVIVHHAGLPYGGLGSFGYRSPHHPHGSSLLLTIFCTLNQTFFMALFFLLSGFFSSIAARKRNRGMFLFEKWKRLGVPTLIYSVFGRGLFWAIVAWRVDRTGWEGVKSRFLAGVKSTRGAAGPTWYTALLLIFDVLYIIGLPQHFAVKLSAERQPLKSNGRSTSIAPAPPRNAIPTTHVILGLSLGAMSTFLIRLRYPFGYTFVPLGLNVGYAPQYILYYCAGIYIQRRGIALDKLVRPRAIITVGAVASGLLAFGMVQMQEVIKQGGNMGEIGGLAAGGFNGFAFLYATLNEYVGFLFGTGLLYVFHRFTFLSKHWSVFNEDVASGSYAAFLVHMHMLLETMTFFDEDTWKDLSPVIKTIVVGGMAVVKSWSLGMVMKWVVEGCGWRGHL